LPTKERVLGLILSGWLRQQVQQEFHLRSFGSGGEPLGE